MLYDEILKELQIDYNKRLTQIEMGKKYGVSQAHIGKLLTDYKNILGIKVETLQKMFPNATIYGKSNHISSSQITNNQGLINSNNNNFLSADKDKIIQDISDKVLIDNDLSNDEKIKFMQFLRKMQ